MKLTPEMRAALCEARPKKLLSTVPVLKAIEREEVSFLAGYRFGLEAAAKVCTEMDEMALPASCIATIRSLIEEANG